MRQAVDVEVFEVNINRVFSVEPDGGPLTKRVGVAFASQPACVILDATGVIGDFQTSDFQVAAVGKVEDVPRALGSPDS